MRRDAPILRVHRSRTHRPPAACGNLSCLAILLILAIPALLCLIGTLLNGGSLY